MSGQSGAQGAVLMISAAAAPMTINLGGYDQEVVPLLLSIVTVVAVRLLFGFTDRGDGAFRREMTRTLLAAIFVLAFDLTYRPTPGLAVLVSAGIGISIIVIIELAGERVVEGIKLIFGGTK